MSRRLIAARARAHRPSPRRGLSLVIILGTSALFPGSTGAQAQPEALSHLKAKVRSVSPTLAGSRAVVAVAVARREAVGRLAPATASAEAEEIPSGINLLQAGSLRLDVARDFLPRGVTGAQRDLADKDIELARLGIEIAEGESDATVEQLVARASGAAAIATRLASEDSLLLGTEEAVRARFAVGDARYVDVLRVRTERLHVTTDLQRSRSEQRIARLQLIRLADAAPDAARASGDAIRLVDAAIAFEAGQLIAGVVPPAPSLDSLLSRSAVLRLSTLAIERAEVARRLVHGERRPTLAGSLGVQRFGTDDDGYSIGPTIGISLTLPFTARRLNDARLGVATREIALATAEQRARLAVTHAALATALDRYETSRTRIASYDAALLRGAREEREAALAGFRTGTLTLLELLDFERALAQAEISRIRSRVEAADALVDLYMIALGETERGSHSPLSALARPENDR